jgi:hypothetical protein
MAVFLKPGGAGAQHSGFQIDFIVSSCSRHKILEMAVRASHPAVVQQVKKSIDESFVELNSNIVNGEGT